MRFRTACANTFHSFVLEPSDVADVVMPRYDVWLMPGAELM
jgi:hypothetical protein